MRKILSILLCFVMAISIAGCGNNSDSTINDNKPQSNITTKPVEDEPTPTDKTDNEAENTSTEFFRNLRIGITDANEDYNIEAKNKDGVIAGVIGRKGSGDLVDMLMSSSDFGNKYNANYDLARNVPNDSEIHIKPVYQLRPVESEFDIDWLNVRAFDIYLDNIYLEAGSNCFEEIVMSDKNNMAIHGTIGHFLFRHYPANKLIESGYYPGGYSSVRFYATTEEKGNITFHFDENSKTFTIESDVEISMLTVRVLNSDNQEVDTVSRDMKGKVIKFTINENNKADMEIIE